MPGPVHPGSGDENQSQRDDFGSGKAAGNAKSGDTGPEASRGPNAGSRPDYEDGEERAQTDNAPGREQRSFQLPTGGYDPSKVEATRERHQGLGMGQRDLERQRDPHRPSAPPDADSRPDGE